MGAKVVFVYTQTFTSCPAFSLVINNTQFSLIGSFSHLCLHPSSVLSLQMQQTVTLIMCIETAPCCLWPLLNFSETGITQTNIRILLRCEPQHSPISPFVLFLLNLLQVVGLTQVFSSRVKFTYYLQPYERKKQGVFASKPSQLIFPRRYHFQFCLVSFASHADPNRTNYFQCFCRIQRVGMSGLLRKLLPTSQTK